MHSKKLRFIHIPKNAGTSIEESIGIEHKTKDHQLYFEDLDWHSCFNFTAIRNPYDRVVSAFYFNVYLINNRVNVVAFRRKLKRYLKMRNPFESFIIDWLKNGRYNSCPHITLKKQCDYFRDDRPYDFIIRYESLLNDFEEFKRITGINKDLNIRQKSERNKDYRRYYTFLAKNLVARHYGEDLELLKYKF